MTDLAEALRENYRLHPLFQFDDSPLELDDAIVSSFGERYRELAPCASTPRGESRKKAEADVTAEFNVIIDRLCAQTQDQLELAFLGELRALAGNLLAGELATFRAQARGADPGPDAPQASSSFGAIKTQRFEFGHLDPEVTRKISQVLQSDLEAIRDRARAGSVRREDLTFNRKSSIVRARPLLNQAFRSLGVLDALSEYEHQRIAVTGFGLELSVSGSDWWQNKLEGLPRAPFTLYAHLDESIGFPKAIVYLSSVDSQSGPTSCYPGIFDRLNLNPLQEALGRVVGYVGASAGSPLFEAYGKAYHQSVNSELFRRHLMRLPESLRFNSHLGWDVMPGSKLESAFMEAEQVLLGEPGTFIVFDGARLFHRGGMVADGDRIALQTVLSNPNPVRRLVKKAKGRFL